MINRYLAGFIILQDQEIAFAVECKINSKSLSPALKYYQDRLNIPKVFQVHLGEKDWGDERDGGRHIPFASFCKDLNMP